MKPNIARRDFLKLAGMLPLGLLSSKLNQSLGLQSDKKNVIIVVFDAFSAYNMSLHGYARETIPNIARLADRAVVYHNHHAGSNFTTSGTASILTGTLPWTHRALQPNGTVAEDFIDRNIFSVFNEYYRISYSHNEWVNTFFNQFSRHIDEWVPKDYLFLPSSDALVQKIFSNDKDVSSVSWVRNVKINEEGHAYSLFLSRIISSIESSYLSRYRSQYPRGLPTARADNGFILGDAIDWLAQRMTAIQKPMFGYFHFLPPHDPYRPERKFAGHLRNDGYQPLNKPRDLFANEDVDLSFHRTNYDEFVLNVDHEFGRLFEFMESSGLLENTLLVLTSDHGEMFERGIKGHMTNALYQPVIKVPLLIFDPAINARVDIYETTSVVDLLPTLANWAGIKIPDWSSGILLPPYRKSSSESERSIFSIRSHDTAHDAPLKMASTTIIKERYKLHYYFGYSELDGKDLVKLYDVQNDPEEMNDLSQLEKDIASEMLGELKTKIQEVNKPYEGS